VSGKLIALMMIGPQSTQTTQSLFHFGADKLSEPLNASMFQIGSAIPVRDFGLPAVSASHELNLSDFFNRIARQNGLAESRCHPTAAVVQKPPDA
jgi:hypothetical protein